MVTSSQHTTMVDTHTLNGRSKSRHTHTHAIYGPLTSVMDSCVCLAVSSPSSFSLKTNTISTSVPTSYYQGSLQDLVQGLRPAGPPIPVQHWFCFSSLTVNSGFSPFSLFSFCCLVSGTLSLPLSSPPSLLPLSPSSPLSLLSSLAPPRALSSICSSSLLPLSSPPFPLSSFSPLLSSWFSSLSPLLPFPSPPSVFSSLSPLSSLSRLLLFPSPLLPFSPLSPLLCCCCGQIPSFLQPSWVRLLFSFFFCVL